MVKFTNQGNFNLTIMRHQFPPIRMANNKTKTHTRTHTHTHTHKQKMTSVCESMDKLSSLCVVGRNVNLCSHCERLYGSSSKN